MTDVRPGRRRQDEQQARQLCLDCGQIGLQAEAQNRLCCMYCASFKVRAVRGPKWG